LDGKRQITERLLRWTAALTQGKTFVAIKEPVDVDEKIDSTLTNGVISHRVFGFDTKLSSCSTTKSPLIERAFPGLDSPLIAFDPISKQRLM
jgi:hypothetical protein